MKEITISLMGNKLGFFDGNTHELIFALENTQELFYKINGVMWGKIATTTLPASAGYTPKSLMAQIDERYG